MIFRRVLVGLLATFAVLLVSLAVLMGFHLLIEGMNDADATAVVRWAGRICLALLLVDLMLLVLALGLYVLNPPEA